MLETPHVAVGAAIASKIPNPYIAIPLAFASHFVFDRVPHWNPHLNTELKKYGKVTKKSTRIVVVDVLIALVVGFYFASLATSTSHTVTILAASFASVLPDVVEGPYFFLKMKTKIMAKYIKWQKSIQVDTSLVPGLFTQLITIVAALWWVKG